MNAVIDLPEYALEAALAAYDIQPPVRIWPAANGIENANYFVQTSGPAAREYVLTLLAQPANAGIAYVPMMDALYARGLPVAPPLRTTAGDAHVTIDGKASMLQPRLPGEHASNPTVKQVESLGRFMARMHRALDESGTHEPIQLPAYPRDLAWLRATAEPLLMRLPFNARRQLADAIDRVASLLDRGDVKALPRGLIHGDLFRDNVLFNERGLTGVLDFHHASHGFRIYDLAVAANDWCTESGTGRLDADRTRAMLRAYHRLSPLTEVEVWHFPVFALYAAVVFWLSRLTVAFASGARRRKNPDEFRHVVAHHMRHSLYLDFRLLDV